QELIELCRAIIDDAGFYIAKGPGIVAADQTVKVKLTEDVDEAIKAKLKAFFHKASGYQLVL
ncbi:MAG: hypothetical protein HRT88_07305, partial [Lentisphaeraceae bacterium]|nr:hypothetical protein [Lentisphaeraceae bacterium]